MAKYQIKNACGHTTELVLFGKNSGRQWRIEQEERRSCLECSKKGKEQERMEAGMQAREIAKERGWVDLEGSEKQCLWAETIRLPMLIGFVSLLCQAKENEKNNDIYESLNLTFNWARSIKEAKWWIDNRTVEKEQDQIINILSLLSISPTRERSPTQKEWIKHLITISPYTDFGTALAADVKDKWLKRQEEQAKKSVMDEYWDQAKILAKRVEEAGWDCLEIKSWHAEKSDGKHLRLYFDDPDMCIKWIKGRMKETISFSRIKRSEESIALAKAIFNWCNSSPDKKIKTLRVR